MSSGGLWCMEHMKVFFFFSSMRILLLGNSEVCVLLVLPFTPIHLLSYLFFKAVKGIKDGRKKTRIPLNSIFILGLTNILWWRMSSWTCRKSHASPSQVVWKISWNHSWQIASLRVRQVSLCSVGMFSRGCY